MLLSCESENQPEPEPEVVEDPDPVPPKCTSMTGLGEYYLTDYGLDINVDSADYKISIKLTDAAAVNYPVLNTSKALEKKGDATALVQLNIAGELKLAGGGYVKVNEIKDGLLKGEFILHVFSAQKVDSLCGTFSANFNPTIKSENCLLSTVAIGDRLISVNYDGGGRIISVSDSRYQLEYFYFWDNGKLSRMLLFSGNSLRQNWRYNHWTKYRVFMENEIASYYINSYDFEFAENLQLFRRLGSWKDANPSCSDRYTPSYNNKGFPTSLIYYSYCDGHPTGYDTYFNAYESSAAEDPIVTENNYLLISELYMIDDLFAKKTNVTRMVKFDWSKCDLSKAYLDSVSIAYTYTPQGFPVHVTTTSRHYTSECSTRPPKAGALLSTTTTTANYTYLNCN